MEYKYLDKNTDIEKEKRRLNNDRQNSKKQDTFDFLNYLLFRDKPNKKEQIKVGDFIVSKFQDTKSGRWIISYNKEGYVMRSKQLKGLQRYRDNRKVLR